MSRLCAIMSRLLRLFFCKNPTDYSHYCIISKKTIIALMALRLFHLFLLAYIIAIIAIITRLFALLVSQTIISIILFEMYYCDYFSS